MRATLCLLLALGCTSPALGWGPDGHRMIGELAIKGLPAQLPSFLRGGPAAEEVGYLSPEPDRERGAGPSFDAERGPAHYVDVGDDLSIAGGPKLMALPQSREQYDTLLRARGSSQYRAGYLPYSIVQGFELLAQDFAYWRADAAGEKHAANGADRAWYAKDRAMREKIVLHDIGIWWHFVGDGSMPLHASVHYNGWGAYPNPEHFTQRHIHSPWESRYVHDNVAQGRVAAAMAPYRDCKCAIESRAARYLMASHDAVVPFYRLEKSGAFDAPTARGTDFTARQIARGAAELRDMIVDAWRASANGVVGFPPVAVSDIEAGTADPLDDLRY